MSRFGKGSEGGRRFRFGPAAASVVFCLAAAAALPAAERAEIISRVEVHVDGAPADPQTTSLVPLKEGDPFSLKDIHVTVRQIFRTGMFSDIRVERGGEDGSAVIFRLNRKRLTRSIRYVADKEIRDRVLRREVTALRQGAYFEEEKLARALAEIEAVLIRDGFFDPDIEVDVAHSPGDPAVDVVFRILSWRRYEVADVAFLFPEGVAAEDLIGKMATRPGREFIPKRLEEDIRRLEAFYDAKGYRRVSVEVVRKEFDPSDGTVFLELRIDPWERISIQIKGADVPTSLLAPIWEERIFEDWGLAEGEARILDYLRERGYVFATLTGTLDRQDNEIRVLYQVEPGKKYRIEDVEFTGLTAFPPARLKQELELGDRILFFQAIDGRRLFELPRDIEIFLQSQGFPEPRIEIHFQETRGRIRANIAIEEGHRKTVGRIDFRGVHAVSPDLLKAEMVSVEGGPYFPPNIQRDIEKIEAFYLDRGIRDTRVAAETLPLDDNVANLVLTVNEGRDVKIGAVIITGNRITKPGVIRRELRVLEDEPASAGRIQESRRRLESLGIFADVRIDEIPVSAGVVNLVITVREAERSYAGLGIGLETRGEPRSLAIWENAVRPRGTAEYIRSNVFGMAAQVSLVTQFSLIEKRAVVSWDQPYFFRMAMRTYMNAWLETEDRRSFGFDRRGASLNTIKPLGQGRLFMTTLSWSRTRLTFLEIEESEVDRRLFPYSTTLLSSTMIWDRRDDSFNPEKGTFFSVVGEWAYPLFRAESDYIKTFLKFQIYRPVWTQLNFSFTTRLGLGRGRMPIPERFFGGGSNSFRGETFDGLGPKDPESGMPVGGKAVFLLNFELKFPMLASLPDLGGAVFLDIGNVFSKRSDFDLLGFKSAVGVGLRYRTPLGPIRFDLGWNLDESERRGRPIAFITIGNVF
ncbi:MAG: POTRA domain-containing protein [Acidobacteriota bacterium]|nr:POTRA domain-containing protein [Acidobacteriota bacterium]